MDQLDPLLAALVQRWAPPVDLPPAAVAVAHVATPHHDHVDRTALELVTLDPAGSRDLDQAFGITAVAGGWQLSYAIADVATWVVPGGALDQAVRERGETFYAPGARIPLHPLELSEGRASLLPGQDTPAVLWTLDVAADGATSLVGLERATVRSRAQLAYPEAQRAVEVGTATGPLALLRPLGEALAHAHPDAVNLPAVEQEPAEVDGGWTLVSRAGVPCEDWNAHLSLATGRAAAQIMLAGGTGLLRTLPDPDEQTVAELRRRARALGVDWPGSWQSFVTGLDPTVPAEAALVTAAGRLLRGAGYRAFVGGAPPAGEVGHVAMAGPYAHVTAPLRRLADRFATECCLAQHAGQPVPGWVTEALPGLPGVMAAADQRGHSLDRAVVDLLEAWVLRERVGQVVDAVALTTTRVALAEPPVTCALVGSTAEPGSRVRVRIATADVARSLVEVALA